MTDRFAMEGRGAYNANSVIQASGGALALPMLEEAAQSVPIAGQDRAIVIADYGSSEGRNSALAIRAALARFRARFGKRRPIIVVHTDLPANDFSTLFRVVEAEGCGYASDDDAVFPSAVGRSFYRSVLPENHVDLGWCSYAAQWLSRTPSLVTGHIVSVRGSAKEREAFIDQARLDWQAFLTLRASELRPGSRLVVAMPAPDAAGSIPALPLFDAAIRAIADMEEDSLLSASERAAMVLPLHLRTREEMLAPFDTSALRSQWRVLSCSITPAGDAAHDQFVRDGNSQALAAKRAGFFRATFGTILASSLASSRPDDDRREFLTHLEHRLRDKIEGLQKPLAYAVSTLALQKL